MIAAAPLDIIDDQLTDQLRAWTLADLISDRYAVSRVPTVTLRRLAAQAQIAVCAQEMHDGARETIQQVRTDITRVIEIRRRLDLQDQQTPRMPQDATDQEQGSEPELTREQQACRLLAAALMLIQGPPDDRRNGGTRVPVGPRPTQPKPPAQANRPPVDIGF